MLRGTYTKINSEQYDKLLNACQNLLDEDIMNDFADKIRRYPKDPVLNWVEEYFPEIIEILEAEVSPAEVSPVESVVRSNASHLALTPRVE